MPQRHIAALAVHLPHVLALQHGIVEHPRRTHEIDAVAEDVFFATGFVPLEHYASHARHYRL